MIARIAGIALLLLLLLVTAAAVIYTRHASRAAFIDLQRLELERDELNAEWSRLQLEQATLADTGRIEQRAREQLEMKDIEVKDTVVLSR